MDRKRKALLQRVRDTILLSAFLGLVLGYVVFDGMYPTVVVPASSGANFVYVILLLASAATLAGLATELLSTIIVVAFASVFTGGVVASVLLLSPVATGVVLLGADYIPLYMAHYGFPFLLLGFLVNVVFGLVGLGLRERVLLRHRYEEPPSWARQRK